MIHETDKYIRHQRNASQSNKRGPPFLSPNVKDVKLGRTVREQNMLGVYSEGFMHLLSHFDATPNLECLRHII